MYQQSISRQGIDLPVPIRYIPLRYREDGSWISGYQREEFLDRYHRRSNVETVFHMIKSKFGDTLMGKTYDFQKNEILGKVVAHNLCVLTQAFYEFGIDPTFLPAPTAGQIRG